MSEGSLPPDLRAWIESVASGDVTQARRHVAGASRQAWSVDLRRDETSVPLFVLRDVLSGNGGSVRDGAVLSALASGPIPVPNVLGVDGRLGAILLERVEGRSEFEPAVSEDERQAVAQHLMQLA